MQSVLYIVSRVIHRINQFNEIGFCKFGNHGFIALAQRSPTLCIFLCDFLSLVVLNR
jgi:hypothetical protein